MARVQPLQIAPPEATVRKVLQLHHRVAPARLQPYGLIYENGDCAIHHHAARTMPALKAKSVRQTTTHQPAYQKVRVSVVEMNNAQQTNTVTFSAQHARQAVAKATVQPDNL